MKKLFGKKQSISALEVAAEERIYFYGLQDKTYGEIIKIRYNGQSYDGELEKMIEQFNEYGRKINELNNIIVGIHKENNSTTALVLELLVKVGNDKHSRMFGGDR